MDRAKVLELLIRFKPEMQERFKVRSIGLFGSMARGDAKATSDIDILVDVDPSIGLGFVRLAERLEQILGRHVDLVSSRAVKPDYRRLIDKELVHV